MPGPVAQRSQRWIRMSGELAALHGSADRLSGIVGGLSPDQLVAPAYPTEWSIADVLSHIGSGAVILRQRLEEIVGGEEADPEFNQSVWDEWNAKEPGAQAADALVADAALLDRTDALDEGQRQGFRFTMGPFDLDFDGFVGLRLNEHALHTWDVEVVVDPAAVLPDQATAVLIDNLEMIARFSGRPTGTEHTVRVRTNAPTREFGVAIGADSLELAATDVGGSPDLELPSESFVRLVYGRLDPDHAPTVEAPAVLDELRAAFPGF
jgi:uncharacterized protein (TIGR03083 family)